MAKWKLPEGRKPITTMESADLVLRMHKKLAAGFTAGDQIEELEARLAKAMDALDEAVYLLAPDEEDMARRAGVYRIVTTLAELRGKTDD
jgi:hypothetical protein